MVGQRRVVWASALVMWVAAATVHAQLGAGALSGQLTDEAGDSVPGALLTATAAGTVLTRWAITGTDGGYAIPGLPPGTYRIRGELSGFRTLIREGVRIAAG